jgi:serralysin
MSISARERAASRQVELLDQRLGHGAVRLAAHASLPVVLTPDLLHLIRINFMLEEEIRVPYATEGRLLLSPIARETDAGVFEIDADVRNNLLAVLEREEGPARAREVASLLWQYTERSAAWADRPELERAQQLTALSFLDPLRAEEWLRRTEKGSGGDRFDKTWFLAMRREFDRWTGGGEGPKTRMDAAHLYETVARLGFRSQIDRFDRALVQRSVGGGFLIQGPPEHGQLWLLDLLLHRIPPTEVVRLSASPDLSTERILAMIAGEIGAWQEAAARLVERFEDHDTVIVLEGVERTDPRTINDFVSDFWGGLFRRRLKEAKPDREYAVVMLFLVDLRGDARFPEYLLDRYIMPLPQIEAFDSGQLQSWLVDSRDRLPADLTADPQATATEILVASRGGVPEPALREIAARCGVPWDEIQAQARPAALPRWPGVDEPGVLSRAQLEQVTDVLGDASDWSTLRELADKLSEMDIGRPLATDVLKEGWLERLILEASQANPGNVWLREAARSLGFAESVREVNVPREISALAQEYEATRVALPPGPDRTRAMEAVVTKMRRLPSWADPELTNALVSAPTPGLRLVAVLTLQRRPDPKHLTWLADRLALEKPFIGYHAAVALEGAAQDLSESFLEPVAQAIERAREGLGPGKDRTDRTAALNRAEAALRDRTPIAAAAPPTAGPPPTPEEVAPPSGRSLSRGPWNLWPREKVISVMFLDGGPVIQSLVQAVAPQWTEETGVSFDFLPPGSRRDADVRVTVNQPFAWSYRGTDALAVPQSQPTLSLGPLSPTTPEEEVSQTVLHAFGHVLGLLDEHQNPNAQIPWNTEALYRTYSGPPNHWTRDQIVQFFLTAIVFTPPPPYRPFDPDSVMLFRFPKELTALDADIGGATALSQSDREFVQRLYPEEKSESQREASALLLDQSESVNNRANRLADVGQPAINAIDKTVGYYRTLAQASEEAERQAKEQAERRREARQHARSEFRSLAPNLSSAPLSTRREAAGKMIQIVAPMDIEDLIKFAHSRKTGERVGAAIGLRVHLQPSRRAQNDPKVVSPLRRLLNDRDSRVRYRAAETLRACPLLLPKFDSDLRRLSEKDPNRHVRDMASNALKPAGKANPAKKRTARKSSSRADRLPADRQPTAKKPAAKKAKEGQSDKGKKDGLEEEVGWQNRRERE